MGYNSLTNYLKANCKEGHPLSGDNAQITVLPDGRVHRRCRTCSRLKMAIYRAAKPKHARATPEDRFWAKVNKNGPIPQHRPELGPCWLWTASLNEDGYGHFWDGVHLVFAHRYSYALANGPIPENLVIDHLCLTRACVRPDHGEAVTVAVNFERSSAVPRLNRDKTHCIRGHPLSGDNLTYLRLHGKVMGRKCLACNRMRVNERRAKERLQRKPVT